MAQRPQGRRGPAGVWLLSLLRGHSREAFMGNIIFAIVIFAIVAAILAGLVRSIRIQHEGKVGVVESWGRFSRVIAPGRYILWPWERVVDEMPLQMFEWET